MNINTPRNMNMPRDIDMSSNMNKGLIAAGVVGAGLGMYKIATMNSRSRKKMMKRGKRALGAMSLMKGMNMLQ